MGSDQPTHFLDLNAALEESVPQNNHQRLPPFWTAMKKSVNFPVLGDFFPECAFCDCNLLIVAGNTNTHSFNSTHYKGLTQDKIIYYREKQNWGRQTKTTEMIGIHEKEKNEKGIGKRNLRESKSKRRETGKVK